MPARSLRASGCATVIIWTPHATGWSIAGGPGLCYIVSFTTWAEGAEESQEPTLPRDPGLGRPTGAAGRNEEVR
jgi:hypothetical protein